MRCGTKLNTLSLPVTPCVKGYPHRLHRIQRLLIRQPPLLWGRRSEAWEADRKQVDTLIREAEERIGLRIKESDWDNFTEFLKK